MADTEATKITEAMLRARGLEPGTFGPCAPQYPLESQVWVQIRSGDKSYHVLKSFAYSETLKMYVYGSTDHEFSNDFSFVNESDIVKPKAIPGQRLKIQLADNVVIAASLMKICTVPEKGYTYHLAVGDTETEKLRSNSVQA